jgi:predicted XRE-type DNA-binding protein
MDWKQIIAEIQRHGQMTQAQIAAAVECGQATISDLAKGSTKQPNYALGAALLKKLEQVKTAPPPATPAQAATETVAGGVANV